MKALPSTIPAGSLIERELKGAHFFDAFEASMPPGVTALEFYLRTVTLTPGWIRLLMQVRNKAVRLVGLKDLGGLHEFDPGRPAADYRVGERLGIFTVLALSDDEVVLGDSDKHLDVKVSFCRRAGTGGARIVSSTVVHVHNRLGRFYMWVVEPFHKQIVPAMLALGGQMMKVHVLQHVPFEGVGSIGPWLAVHGAEIGYTRFYESAALPDPAALDLIIAMGGPMSVNDEESLPWLVAEKQFVREAIARGVAVVGICLGAQLIASALGARVYPGRQKEIGWYDVEAVPGSDGPFRFPPRSKVFHWHGETFDLPPGAVHLARSAACEHQAFQVGGRVIGLQFHLETTPESAGSILDNCRGELIAGPFVQTEAALRGAVQEDYARINDLMGEVLDYVTRQT